MEQNANSHRCSISFHRWQLCVNQRLLPEEVCLRSLGIPHGAHTALQHGVQRAISCVCLTVAISLLVLQSYIIRALIPVCFSLYVHRLQWWLLTNSRKKKQGSFMSCLCTDTRGKMQQSTTHTSPCPAALHRIPSVHSSSTVQEVLVPLQVLPGCCRAAHPAKLPCKSITASQSVVREATIILRITKPVRIAPKCETPTKRSPPCLSSP